MTLEELNAIDREFAEQALLRCCASRRWAREMAARRPFRDAVRLVEEADEVWRGLDVADRLEAFAAHPRIGELARRGGTGRSDVGEEDWSAREQAGMAGAAADVRARLAAANRDYESRFGFTYLVCATGKSAAEMLAIAERRLTHSRDEELGVAAEEQRQITRVRLAALLESRSTP
jgi:OHCU decarboxylase